MRLFQKVCAHLLIFWAFPVSAWQWSNHGSVPACVKAMPTLKLNHSQEFDHESAALMLWSSWLTEESSPTRLQWELRVQGLKNIHLIGRSRQRVSAFYAETDAFRLLVFRGSREFEEWFRNAMFYQDNAKNLGFQGAIHSGIGRHFAKLVPDLARILPELRSSQKPWIISGHSLGGAMALLHALWLLEQGESVHKVYSSGAPRIGDQQFYDHAMNALQDRFYAIESSFDLTPMVPPSQAVAQDFADLLPGNLSRLRQHLEDFVATLGYASPSWLTLRLGELPSHPREMDVATEREYWYRLKAQLQAVTSFSEFWEALDSRNSQHPPEHYLCQMLNVPK